MIYPSAQGAYWNKYGTIIIQGKKPIPINVDTTKAMRDSILWFSSNLQPYAAIETVPVFPEWQDQPSLTQPTWPGFWIPVMVLLLHTLWHLGFLHGFHDLLPWRELFWLFPIKQCKTKHFLNEKKKKKKKKTWPLIRLFILALRGYCTSYPKKLQNWHVLCSISKLSTSFLKNRPNICIL